MTKEALTLALEALETLHDENMDYIVRNKLGGENNQCMVFARDVIKSIKRTLAQPEQEPVATDWERIARVQNAKLMAMCNEAGGFEKLCEVMDKYEQTTPPQRTWVGLTDEEIDFIDAEITKAGYCQMKFTRAIEAKCKENNT